MPDTPVISVVIPLYNKGPHIARAIYSVLKQTEQRFEIVIVDGHSTDDGPEIVNSFKDERIFFYEQTGSGVSSGRNEGVCHSKSGFIAFLDADDEWMPEHLMTLLRLHKVYPEAGLYTTAYFIKYPNSRVKQANYSVIPNQPWEGLIQNYFKSAAVGFPPVLTSMVGIPKHLFMEFEGFKEGVWWGEDTDLWGRIALKYSIAFSWNGMGTYHTEALNRASDMGKPIEENIFVRTAMEAIEACEVSPKMKNGLLEYVAMKQISTAYFNIRARDPKLARENLKKCSTKKLAKKIWMHKYLALVLSYAPRGIYLLLRRIKTKIRMMVQSG